MSDLFYGTGGGIITLVGILGFLMSGFCWLWGYKAENRKIGLPLHLHSKKIPGQQALRNFFFTDPDDVNHHGVVVLFSQFPSTPFVKIVQAGNT
jgi:hypothetical protein